MTFSATVNGFSPSYNYTPAQNNATQAAFLRLQADLHAAGLSCSVSGSLPLGGSLYNVGLAPLIPPQ